MNRNLQKARNKRRAQAAARKNLRDMNAAGLVNSRGKVNFYGI